MAVRGQRFTLDPDADSFTFNIDENQGDGNRENAFSFVKEIKERQTTSIPPPPKPKQSRTGFPQHRLRSNASAVGSHQQQKPEERTSSQETRLSRREPSDRAILNHITRKYGIDPEAKERAEISEENKRRIANMSTTDIEEARSEIMSNFSPAFIERLLKRANIEEDQNDQDWDKMHEKAVPPEDGKPKVQEVHKSVRFSPRLQEEEKIVPHVENVATVMSPPPNQVPSTTPSEDEAQIREVSPSIHFPIPPRNPDDYVPLNPDSPSFLSDLKKHYFPNLPEDPSTLSWLRSPSAEESESSSYAPTQSRYAPSDIRFGFTGRLIAPIESREIPVSRGLHHHGHAPESAGYTVPELSLLARSSLPNQRCVSYQVLGRILYRLGRGDFGQRGSELQEGLWRCIEKERPIEVMMSEANRAGGHVSAKAYATEALWLWRKGGGGDRGILKPGETIAK